MLKELRRRVQGGRDNARYGPREIMKFGGRDCRVGNWSTGKAFPDNTNK